MTDTMAGEASRKTVATGQEVWVKATASDVCTSCVSVSIETIHDKPIGSYVHWKNVSLAAKPSAGAQGEAVAHSVYLSAVAGRMAFRDAYRRCLPVVKAAEALATKWTTHGQKVDSDDFYAAIHDVCEAAMKRNGEHEATDRALAAVATTAQTDTGAVEALREAIARIIDPAAFLFTADELGTKDYNHPAAEAYSKADRILAQTHTGDVKVLREALEPFAALADKFTGPMVEVSDPHPDNPSRNIQPLPTVYLERANQTLAALSTANTQGGAS